MDGHFGAFSFVDRITQLEAGKRAAGCFAVPAHLSRFSPCLALEAAGQLAAWLAIADLDFQLGPVAGLAVDLRFGTQVHPGQTPQLESPIGRGAQDAVRYSASAYGEGVKVIDLEHSLGPMLP